jgi:hypothetical protein
MNWILALLPVIGVVFAGSIWWRGASLDPTVAAEGFVQAALMPGAGAAWLAILFGMVLYLPAVMALALRLGARRLSWWGMVLSVVGVALVLPLIGFMALASNVLGQLYMAGDTSVLAVAAAFYNTPAALALLSMSSLAYTAGYVLLALNLRRQWHAPWLVVVAFALQALCLSVLALFSFAAELAGALLLVYAGLWIGRRAWREG